MANRLIRNTAILLKTESVYGTDPTPDGATDALLVSGADLSINPLNAQNVDRNIIRPYLGGSQQLLGTKYVEMGFSIPLAGSGTVATAPKWAQALLALGYAQTLTATVRADYTPISTAFPSCTIYWNDDGVLHKATGCRGTATAVFTAGQRPELRCRYTGLYYPPTEGALPTIDLSGFQIEQVVTDANTQDLTLGATHSTTLAPAFATGTAYPSQGIEIDLGNVINFNALIGGETVDLTDRRITARATMDLTAAQEVAMYAAIEAGTLTTLGLIHGTVSNRKVGVWMPSMSRSNLQKVDVNGKRMSSLEMQALPVSGNDELRIITSF